MRGLIVVISSCIFAFNAYCQTGIIQGTIIDQVTKDEMVGAKVFLLETNYRTMADIYGVYKLDNIPQGTYSMEVTYMGYKTYETSVTVVGGETLVHDIEMQDDVVNVEGVNVVAQRKTNTDNAIVLEIKEAKAVVSGISSEQIARSTDKTAAEAMQRIPGITIVENRFAIVRGVNTRYNNVVINNVVAPSTEIDRRTFSFDMIPSGALDRMMIYKTASPEYVGDFAGGLIKLYTKNSITQDELNVKITTGFRNNTTFTPYFQSEGAATDFLGFDNSFRQLPNDFPIRNVMMNEGPTSEIRRDAARMLPNNFMPHESVALPDLGVSVNYAKKFTVGGMKASTFNSINYSQSFKTYQRDFYRYQIWTNFDEPIEQWFAFVDNVYEKDNKVNIMSNWSLQLNERSKIRFSNLFNQLGENTTIIRNGENFFVRPGEDLQNYMLGYKSRTIYSGQLEGEHKLGESSKNNLSWVVGGSYLGELEPDLRRFRRFKDQDSTTFLAQFSPSSNLFDNSRYYGELSEFSVNHGLNYKLDISADDKNERILRAGYYTDYRARGFSSRYFSNTYPGFFSPIVFERIQRLPVNEIFAPENFETLDGLILQEGTRPIDAYTASNFLNAAYFMGDFNFGALNISGGIRTEYNILQMQSQDDFGPINVDNPVLSVLPSLNSAVMINDNNLIRLGYARTVNRPEFRELAPFLFYDYELESSRVGNPELKTATIDNVDLRYENYGRPGETFSVGVFYKQFTNPIEDRLILTTEQSSLTFINADFAFAYGAEIEYKKSLKGLTGNSFLDKLSINLNASIIHSEVDLGETATAQDQVRALQGQSPYIVNAALYYNNNKAKINASIIYNIYGRNIFAVGDVSFPTIYELERHSLDLTFGKQFENGFGVKAAVRNILDFPFRFYQDSSRDGKIDLEVDHPIIEFRTGALFMVTLSYDLLHNKKTKE
jgi:hypothetical protein